MTVKKSKKLVATRKRIYLDTAASTELDQRVLNKMLPYLKGSFGNPSSLHKEGVSAKVAVSSARMKIAEAIEGHSDEIIFTSGGTEANNLAILGVAHGLLKSKKISKPGHIITSQIEHRSVLEACRVLEEEGWDISYLPISDEGLIESKNLKDALRKDTVLVSIIYANNEIGTIQPIRELAKIIRHHRKQNPTELSRLPYFHIDACQAPRFLPLSVEKLGIDLMTINGSKIYGPKGVGCLFVRRNTFLDPIIVGGGQEAEKRSGTENVAGIVGLAEALEIAVKNSEKESEKLSVLRDYFINQLLAIENVSVNGSLIERLPNNVNVTFPGVFGEYLVFGLDAKGVACSTGSACSRHHKDDSHVIMSLGKDRQTADSTIRFSLDRNTTKKEIDYTLSALKFYLRLNIKTN